MSLLGRASRLSCAVSRNVRGSVNTVLRWREKIAEAIRKYQNRNAHMSSTSSKLKAGDWVEVRSKEEILRTLDAEGRLDGMPFMPEMFAFCGKRFQVYKRAHKTCDTAYPVRGRRVNNAVHLET